MSTEAKITGTSAQEEFDAVAVLRHAFHGGSLDPEVRRRVHERAARVTEQIYRLHGEIDTETISALFRDDDDS